MKAIYIIGAPGSGKTTLINHLTQNWTVTGEPDKPIKHTLYQLPDGRTATQLGHARPPFGGTDTLPYTAINTVEPWLNTLQTDILLAEGDRLANARFLAHLSQHAELTVIYLSAAQETLNNRRSTRQTQHNLKPQNPTWLQGRHSKALNLAQAVHAIFLNADQPPTSLAQQVATYL